MPKRKKKSRGSGGAGGCQSPDKSIPSASLSTEPGTGNRNIYLKNCGLVQIDNTNIVTSNHNDSTATKQCHDASKEHQGRRAALVIIKNILVNRQRRVALPDLEADIREVLAKGDTNSFKELAGVQLKRFLREHEHDFDIKVENGKVFIELVNGSDEVQGAAKASYTEAVLGAEGGVTVQVAGTVDVESCGDSKCPSSSEDDAAGTSQSGRHGKQKDGDNWYQVVGRKKKSCGSSNHSDSPVSKPMAREIVSEGQQRENAQVSKLKDLLTKCEDDDLQFVSGHDTYAMNILRCQRDIVSMWNTPHRVKSFIVIGVETKEGRVNRHLGTDRSFDDEFYLAGNLFSNNVFTMAPQFEYFRVECNSLVYGIIEIYSSCKHGQPCVVKEMAKEGDVELLADELWYRNGPQNSLCKPSNPQTGMIYQWFLGATGTEKVDTIADGNGNTDMQGKAYVLNNSEFDNCSSQTQGTEATEVVDTEFSKFCKQVKDFKKGHFILLSGDVSNTIKNLANFALIPLLAVYDLDVYSCTNGLFNAVEHPLEKRCQVRIGTWKETPPAISESSTYWCFLRGRRELADTRTDSLDGNIEDHHEWFRTVKNGVVDNCDQLASFAEEYTVLTIIVLWPKEEKIIPFIRKFLYKMVETISPTPRILVCLHQPHQTDYGHTELKSLMHEYHKTGIHLCQLDYSQLCLGISSKISSESNPTFQYTLPQAPNDCLPDCIDDKDALWLKEDLEVLYLKNLYRKASQDETAVEDENNKFYKGGTLQWFAWYENDSCSLRVDIDRDVLKEAVTKVEDHIGEYKSSVVTILHAPGSGGTTLAQRILWDLHTRIPCVHAKVGTLLKSKDLAKKLELIHDKTQLSVLLLVDGDDETKVKYFSRTLKNTIILHVKRYPYSMNKVHQKPGQQNKEKNKIYLKGDVSHNEAVMLVCKFGDRCGDQQKQRLRSLKNDIKKKKLHNMYEFGMTVYKHEFKGIVSYVRGYLQLPTDHRTALLPWQLCLGYMSLVYYYGQTAVPCQFFARLFGKPSNYVMSLEDDFPYPTTEFIVYDVNDRREKTLRICHYEVAKEILEQVLSIGLEQNDHRTDRLGRIACKNLAEFSKDFIKYCGQKHTTHSTCQALGQAVRHILTKTFIHRDERDIGEGEEQSRKRQQVSQLLLDIPSGKPTFKERLQVLETLVQSFPNDPNFHAHVGRFHAFCGPEDRTEAERHFKRAISICEDRNKKKGKDDLDESAKQTLMHVYHMYGVVRKREISDVTGYQQNSEPKLMGTTEQFCEMISELVNIAEEACDYFQKSRDLTPDTCDIFIHAFTCEIGVRLQICDYVKRHFTPKTEESRTFVEFFNCDAEEGCKVFVEESISKIENLLLECNLDVEMEHFDQANLRKQVKWFNALFKRQDLPEESLSSGDDICRLRRKITLLKLDNGAANSQTNSIEGVKDSKTVHTIIEYYEEIFHIVQSNGVEDVQFKDLDHDYRQWILAIRHDLCTKSYDLRQTLTHVSNWHHRLRSPMSTFYLFIIKSILGFGTSTLPGNTEYLLDAKELLKHGLSRTANVQIRPRFPREWLGTDEGIKIIQPGGRNHGYHAADGCSPGMDLAICKGTIQPPNNKQFYGQIAYDLKVDTVNLYFIPNKANLDGPRYANQRVEFKMAFSIEKGYEAFNVKLLKRHGCSKCSATVEFTSADVQLACTACAEQIYKDDLNEITDSGEVNTDTEN